MKGDIDKKTSREQAFEYGQKYQMEKIQSALKELKDFLDVTLETYKPNGKNCIIGMTKEELFNHIKVFEDKLK